MYRSGLIGETAFEDAVEKGLAEIVEASNMILQQSKK